MRLYGVKYWVVRPSHRTPSHKLSGSARCPACCSHSLPVAQITFGASRNRDIFFSLSLIVFLLAGGGAWDGFTAGLGGTLGQVYFVYGQQQ